MDITILKANGKYILLMINDNNELVFFDDPQKKVNRIMIDGHIAILEIYSSLTPHIIEENKIVIRGIIINELTKSIILKKFLINRKQHQEKQNLRFFAKPYAREENDLRLLILQDVNILATKQPEAIMEINGKYQDLITCFDQDIRNGELFSSLLNWYYDNLYPKSNLAMNVFNVLNLAVLINNVEFNITELEDSTAVDVQDFFYFLNFFNNLNKENIMDVARIQLNNEFVNWLHEFSDTIERKKLIDFIINTCQKSNNVIKLKGIKLKSGYRKVRQKETIIVGKLFFEK